MKVTDTFIPILSSNIEWFQFNLLKTWCRFRIIVTPNLVILQVVISYSAFTRDFNRIPPYTAPINTLLLLRGPIMVTTGSNFGREQLSWMTFAEGLATSVNRWKNDIISILMRTESFQICHDPSVKNLHPWELSFLHESRLMIWQIVSWNVFLNLNSLYIGEKIWFSYLAVYFPLSRWN